MLKRLHFRTVTIRVALVYLGVFLLSALIVSGVIYKVTEAFLDRQAEETIVAELDGLMSHYNRGGLPKLIQVLGDRTETAHTTDLLLLADPAGGRVIGNLPAMPAVTPDRRGWLSFRAGTGLAGQDDAPPNGLMAMGILRRLPDGHKLLVGIDLGEWRRFRSQIVQSLFWSFTVILAISAVGGLLVSRHFTHRLETINRTTRKIIDGHLHARIPRSSSEDELDRLAANVNDMLDQIEDLMTGLRHVSEGIAHDLRTPLNRLRGQLEMAVIETREGDPTRDMIQEAIAEADRLLDMFSALLSIAKAKAGYQQMPLVDVPLSPVLWRVVELYEPVAEERRIDLNVRVDVLAVIRGQEQLLAQALANLVDNAVKYTPEGGRIDVIVTVGKDAGWTEIIIADNGIGIPVEDHERVLGRFIRLDWSRSTPGNGLGLSLVDAVTQLHGAKLVMEDNQPGLRVRLCFPPAPATGTGRSQQDLIGNGYPDGQQTNG